MYLLIGRWRGIPLVVRFVRTAFLSIALASASELSAAAVKADYHLNSTPENTVILFSSENAPVLKIKSGQIVEIDTVCLFGMTDEKPEQFFIDNGISLDLPVVKDMIAVKNMVKAAPVAGTPMTGPIFIEGAVPGDTLEVRILDIKSRASYGVNQNAPGRGGIPDLVPRPYAKVIKLDLERNVAKFSDSIEVPLHPFQGRMAVSPVKEKGKLSSSPPYPDIGGNMDNKHLGKGATVYFPVQVNGALFQTGDPHAVQGNGEVGQSALESCNTVTMQFFLRKDVHITRVEAETPTHYIIMGMDKDLNVAMHESIANTVEFLRERKGLDFFDALALCSLAVDYEVTEVVDGTKGIHGMVPKGLFKKNTTSYWYHEEAAYAAKR
ncbi:MAG TPA: acetamidase/formamidase family protein [Opitutaceae bacterium]|nr:acetamidase/formamidase family protein [Opitutaceae bacterium]